MRVIFVGDACVSTGFARCTHAACDAIHAAGHEVFVLGMNYHGDPHGHPYPVFPCVQPHDGGRDYFGVTRLPVLIERLRPDVVVLLNDPWNVAPYLDAYEGFLKERERQGMPTAPRPKFVAWLAVDAENQDGKPLNRLDHVAVWTAWAGNQLAKGGYGRGWYTIPLGVDSTWRPANSEERSAARRAVLPARLADGAFVVGVIGRNQPRKRLDLALRYFADWKSDAYLLLHVAPTGESGTHITSLVHYYGLDGRVLLSRPHIGHGHSQVELQQVYWALDVYWSTSQGEGWGLPALEAMASGVPCVLPDFAAFGDWARGAAALVPCSARALNAPLNSMAYTLGGYPDGPDSVHALEMLRSSQIHRAELRRRGLERALRFSWEKAGSEFVQMLEQVVEEPVAAEAG